MVQSLPRGSPGPLNGLERGQIFAIDSVASKPVKPCDEGVLEGAEFAPENRAKHTRRGRAWPVLAPIVPGNGAP